MKSTNFSAAPPSTRPSRHTASVAGRFAREAAARGEGEVCAVFRRSFYARFPGGRYACIGEPSLGRGPLNALVPHFENPVIGKQILLSIEDLWHPPAIRGIPDLEAIRQGLEDASVTVG